MTNEKNEFKQLEEELFKKAAYRKEIERQDLAFEIAETIIDARINMGMTQKELAKKIKTKQSGVARLESGRYCPNFKSLEKIAKIFNIKMRNPLAVEEKNKPAHFYIHYYTVAANDNIKTEISCNNNDKISKFNTL